MAKEIKFDTDARELLKKGVDQLAKSQITSTSLSISACG